MNMFLRLPSKDIGDVALQKICSRSTHFWNCHWKMNLFLGLALEDGGEATLQQGCHWLDQHVSEIVCLGDVSEIVCLGDELELGSIQHVSEIFIGRWGVERQVLETPSELRANMNRWMQSHSRRVELSPFQKLSVNKKQDKVNSADSAFILLII